MTEQTPDSDSGPITDRSDAQASGRHRWLTGRIGQWRESGLITDEQSRAILDFESVGPPRFRLGLRFNRLIVVLSTLGAVLIGAGLISFVASNWDGIPAMAKLFLLLAGQITTFWAAYQLQFVRGYPRVGGAIMFAGAAWFGANVFLVAQSYHLATDNPDLLIWWFLGILPLAYITRSKPITVMAVGIFTVGISWKAASQTDDADSALLVIGTLILAAAAIYAIGMLHLRRENLKFYAGPYLIGGALLAIGLTYLLTFDGVFNELQSSRSPALTGPYLALAAIVSGISIAAIVVNVWNSVRSGEKLVSRFAEPSVVALVIGSGWLIATMPFSSPGPYVIGFNLLLVLLIFGSIVLGIVNKREALVNVGIVFFVIDLSTRYIELTVDMLDTSLAFIVGGLLLLGIGYAMERGRRRLLRQFGMMEVTSDT